MPQRRRSILDPLLELVVDALQVVFHALALGDVLTHAEQPGELATLVERLGSVRLGDGHHRLNIRLPGLENHAVVAEDHRFLLTGLYRQRDRRHGGEVILVETVEIRHGLVDHDVVRFEIFHEHEHRQRIDHRAQQLAALANLLLRRPASRDVPVPDLHTRPAIPAHHSGGDLGPEGGAVLAQVSGLVVLGWISSREAGVGKPAQALVLRRIRELEDARQSQHLFLVPVAEKLGERPIGIARYEIVVHEQCLRRGIDQDSKGVVGDDARSGRDVQRVLPAGPSTAVILPAFPARERPTGGCPSPTSAC